MRWHSVLDVIIKICGLCIGTTLVETPSSSIANYPSSRTPVSALSIVQLSHTQSSSRPAGADSADTTVEEDLERDPNVGSPHTSQVEVMY